MLFNGSTLYMVFILEVIFFMFHDCIARVIIIFFLKTCFTSEIKSTFNLKKLNFLSFTFSLVFEYVFFFMQYMN